MYFDPVIKLSDILTIIALIVGPILAVQIQKIVEDYKEKKNRKLLIFKTLMATRALPLRLAPDHIQALNMIDIEFYNDKKYSKVITAWKEYLKLLGNKELRKVNLDVWVGKRDALFICLLLELGESLGYKFSKDQLEEGIYIPEAYGQKEIDNQAMREGIKKVLSGEQALSMKIKSVPPLSEEQKDFIKNQKTLHESLLECVEGKKPLQVDIVE